MRADKSLYRRRYVHTTDPQKFCVYEFVYFPIMWLKMSRALVYTAVPLEDPDISRPSRSASKTARVRGKPRWTMFTILFLIILFLIFTGIGLHNHFQALSLSFRKCTKPAIRREWRQLSTSEKFDYITAVKCLHEIPSQLNSLGKLSDDFSWVHIKIGSYCKSCKIQLPIERSLLTYKFISSLH